MNISTGVPYILLFERDQQLATLLGNELQLAGYEYHTARTAVEVFDAIARYQVRLVLVNLAQAAAARREFWVALDTQRKGSGVQVFTFHCANLAGYGPRDPDEYNSTTLADIEVDGMMGLMNLVDAVRARVPNAESMENTLPRVPRLGEHSPNATAPMATPRVGQAQSPPGMGQSQPMPAMGQNGSGAAYYTPQNGNSSPRPASPRQNLPTTPQRQVPAPPGMSITPQISISAPPAPFPGSTGGGRNNDKIRAVLYPTQRTWNSEGAGTTNTNWQDTTTMASQGANGVAAPSPSDSMLQRLANGRFDPNESGLEQLSRLAQGNPETTREEASTITYQSSKAETMTSGGIHGPTASTFAPVETPTRDTSLARVAQFSEYGNTGPMNLVPSAPRPVQDETPISAQPMRPAPIQDLPLERTTTSESVRRPDVLARANYGQPAATQPAGPQPTAASQSPLASIVTAATSASSTNGTQRTAMPAPAPSSKGSSNGQTAESIATGPISIYSPNLDEVEKPGDMGQYEKSGEEESEETPMLDHNAVILDILQSLPAMPAPQSQQQSIQAQVLNGRATRSLGSVLLDGHLVPQDRLEVAQNIQRMLRGVDLNYQLGDILLMFKLLSPDQLLAASLVSYGLLSTTQISTLGRIRQELHSIGLEYDLENLLILFRILTPEQLREVRANVQN